MDNEKDNLAKVEEERSKKESRYKISNKHVIGFIAGVLVTTILAFASKWATDSSELVGTSVYYDDFNYEPNMPEVTNANFKEEVLESDQPVIVFYTATEASYATTYMLDIINRRFTGKILKYNVPRGTNYLEDLSVDVPSYQDLEDLISYPLLILYNKGKELGRQSLVVDEGEIYKWVTMFVGPAVSTLTPTPKPTPLPPTPTPAPLVPTIYRAFPSCMEGELKMGPDSFCVGELILNPYDFAIEDSYLCNGDEQLPIQGNTALYSMLQNAYGGDKEWFGIPDLTAEAPLGGMSYYIMTNGSYSIDRSGNSEIKVGNISYFAEEEPYNYSEFLIGQIVLAKDLNESITEKILIPCDGRELDISYNQALFTLIGTNFGGNGTTTFNVPDLSMLQPIEGAKYYMVVGGIYPTQKW